MQQNWENLNRGEQEFIEACQSGHPCILGDGSRPLPDNPDRVVRGEIVRFFTLGGADDMPTHARGVELHGAIITQHFDLSGSDSDCDIVLVNCIFQREPRLHGTKVRSLDLRGTHCPGLSAEGITTSGSLMLRDGFHARGSVRIVRARIGADLDCSGGRFDTPDGDALNGDGATIGGSLFMMATDEDTPKPTRCIGTARFVSASIGDSVMILDAAFDSGSQKYALSFALASVRRQLTFRRFASFHGRLNLSGVKTYSLNDDPDSATAPTDMILNGLSYVHFGGQSLKDVETRLLWLSRQNPEAYGQDFWPQPYGQLASVLTNMGHETDARRVLIEKERLQARTARKLARQDRRWARLLQIWISDQFLRRVIGYGYRPQRSLLLGFVIIAATALFFQSAWQAGDMAPGAAPILVSAEWQNALRESPEHTARAWSEMRGAARDYETFNAIAYAVDLFVPLIDLGQQSAWSPSTERGPLGQIGWWLRWVVEIVGWIITALAAAAVTGLVRRN